MKESEKYDTLKPVICISILNEILFDKLEKAHNCFLAIEKDNPEFCLCEDFQLHFFELPKMKEDKVEALKDELSKWAWFLKNEGQKEKEEEMEVLMKNEPVLKKAHMDYLDFTKSDRLRAVYDARLKLIRDEQCHIDYALKKGREEGREEGFLNSAQLLLNSGFSIEKISDLLKIPTEKLERLLKKSENKA